MWDKINRSHRESWKRENSRSSNSFCSRDENIVTFTCGYEPNAQRNVELIACILAIKYATTSNEINRWTDTGHTHTQRGVFSLSNARWRCCWLPKAWALHRFDKFKELQLWTYLVDGWLYNFFTVTSARFYLANSILWFQLSILHFFPEQRIMKKFLRLLSNIQLEFYKWQNYFIRHILMMQAHQQSFERVR